jgi:ribonuclease P protein component
VARGRRIATPGFVLQARARESGAESMRIGITCSKKVGGAVARNHAKRRLREIARLVLPDAGRPGWDYVLIGRRDTTAGLSFAGLTADLAGALARLHRDP